MTRVDVEPDTFDAVSKIFGQTIADTLFRSFTTLQDGLSGCGAMAGTDPGGTKWGSEYDKAVVEITGVTQDVINGVYRLAGLLETTGFNHGQANSASTPGGTVKTTDTMSYDEEVLLATPPPAAGGSGSTPHGWGLISDLVGYVWPNGDQDKLRAAGSAWSTAAQSVTSAGYEVPQAVAEISMQTSPEVADATQACNSMGTHLSELSAAYSSMSTACNDYAQHLDDAHKQVIDELVNLLEWTVGLEVGGALLSVVTVGISEGAANAALAVRCAAVAARVGGILGRLIELAGEVAQTIVNALARVIEISQKLKALLGTKLSQATAAVVDRLPGIGKTTEELATDGLKAGCFVAGTMVVTVDGLQPIENLVVGDKVVAGDPGAATQQVHPITAAFIRTVPVVLDLCVQRTKITCSPEHPLWVNGVGWRNAGTLHVGDALLTQGGCPTQIDFVKRHQGVFTVYNIEVAGIHTYCVSELGIIAHNKAAKRPYKTPKKGGTGKAGSTDIPSWAKGERPYQGESGKDFATRIMDEKYGPGGWSSKGSREFSQLKKFGDRHFE
jgi:hypothetical protein